MSFIIFTIQLVLNTLKENISTGEKDCKELNYNQKRVEGENVLPTVSDGVGLGKMIC